MPDTDATTYGEMPHSNMSLVIKQEAPNQSFTASSCRVVLCVPDTTVDKIVRGESSWEDWCTDLGLWTRGFTKPGCRLDCQEARAAQPNGGHLAKGRRLASAATKPRQAVGCSLVSLAVLEGSFIQNPITNRQLWRLTFQPQTPNGNKSSRHFKGRDMLAFLAALKAYSVTKMHSNAHR